MYYDPQICKWSTSSSCVSTLNTMSHLLTIQLPCMVSMKGQERDKKKVFVKCLVGPRDVLSGMKFVFPTFSLDYFLQYYLCK